MGETRIKSKDLKALGKKIIKKFEKFDFIKDNKISIEYLYSDNQKKSKSKLIFADCEKVADKYKWAIKADFIITFYAPHTVLLDENQQEILMEHELMHIGQDNKGNLIVKPHDIEDFTEIVEKYGLNWEEIYD